MATNTRFGAARVMVAEQKVKFEKESATTGAVGLHLIELTDFPEATQRLYSSLETCAMRTWMWKTGKKRRKMRNENENYPLRVDCRGGERVACSLGA